MRNHTTITNPYPTQNEGSLVVAFAQLRLPAGSKRLQECHKAIHGEAARGIMRGQVLYRTLPVSPAQPVAADKLPSSAARTATMPASRFVISTPHCRSTATKCSRDTAPAAAPPTTRAKALRMAASACRFTPVPLQAGGGRGGAMCCDVSNQHDGRCGAV